MTLIDNQNKIKQRTIILSLILVFITTFFEIVLFLSGNNANLDFEVLAEYFVHNGVRYILVISLILTVKALYLILLSNLLSRRIRQEDIKVSSLFIYLCFSQITGILLILNELFFLPFMLNIINYFLELAFIFSIPMILFFLLFMLNIRIIKKNKNEFIVISILGIYGFYYIGLFSLYSFLIISSLFF